MRRYLTALAATAVMTPVLLIIPVSADPGPEAVPVPVSDQELPLGSVDAPEGEAEVQTGTTAPVPGYESTPALTLSEPDTAQFSTVGVTWARDDAVTDIVIKIRVKDAAGQWSDWIELGVDDIGVAPNPQAAAAGVLRGGSEPHWAGSSFGAELELLTRSGSQPHDVQLILLDPGSAPADVDPQSPDIQDLANAAASMPPIYSRAQWGANEGIRNWDPEYASTIKAATIHHTAGSNTYSAADVPAILRSIYQYHAVSRGWGDIGYNVIVDKFGRVWEGRYGGLSSTVIGAHAGGFNSYTFGVSMLGNYDVAPTTGPMISSVAAVVAWKFGLYGVNPSGSTTLTSGGGGTAKYPAGRAVTLPTIFGHRDVGSTTCPGSYGYAKLGEIRSTVAANMGSGLRDVSPSGVAAVRAQSGQTTVVVRGTDSGLFTRTSLSGGGWGNYVRIPASAADGAPAAVSADGTRIDVVVRGTDGGYWQNYAALDGNGIPAQWRGWYSLGGKFTSAPGVGATGPNTLGIVGRGTDGAMWQMNWTGSAFLGWTSLGGSTISAPAVQGQVASGSPRYVVSAVGADSRVWIMTANGRSPGATASWAASRFSSSLGPQTDGASSATVGAGTLSIGVSGGASFANPTDGKTIALGGRVSSTVGLVRMPDGSVWAFARGLDGQLWMTTWSPGSGQASWGWAPVGGQLI